IYFCNFTKRKMKKNIAVLSGGYSGEFEISVQSGQVVKKYLDNEKYNIFPILIKGKDWYYKDEGNQKILIDKNDFSLTIKSEKIRFDCVFIAIHGTPGEDGKLQGYFDMLGIPYTSCNQATSALTFNKYFCKNYILNFDVATPESIHLVKSNKPDISDILQKFNLPVFVKPNNGGSSVGMSKVHNQEELEPAIKKAFAEDDEILIEEYIEGREITCSVIQHKGKLIIFPVLEIICKKEFFDFEAKYDPALAEEVVPARISSDVEISCKETSALLYEKLNCKGVVRFDYIFNDSGLYFLEVNTIPGLTEASIVPKMARSYGLSLEELFSMMVEEV
ncbi:MAG: D-alanine--D-alanine ligase, partial [Bacteroidales bacterium]|nr:D-alanine--D-alanine ligase [Bacteroidales bacterium]